MMNDTSQTTNSQDRVIPASNPTKACLYCGEVKPFSEFARNARTKDGLRDCCKCCISANQQDSHINQCIKDRQAMRTCQHALSLANTEAITLRQELSTCRAKQAPTETLVADVEIKIDQMMKYYAKEIKRDFNTIMFQFNHDLKAHAKGAV